MTAEGFLDYVELPARDVAAAKAFYGAMFGWTFVDYGPDYAEFDSAGRKGGFNPELKSPLIVLYARDLDTMEAKLRAAGAEITAHHQFPGGRRFHFRDPNGNELAMWSKE